MHKASGAAFQPLVAGQKIVKKADLGSPYDSVVDYAGDNPAESTTVYIFRSAYPDAGAWFERALHTVGRDIPLNIFEAGSTEPMRAFGATVPNGLQKIYSTSEKGPFKTTSMAMAQAGEWLVKIRVTSAELDRAGVAARLAEFASAIRFPDGTAFMAAGEAPAACSAPAAAAAGKQVASDEAKLALGLAGGIIVAAESRQPLSAAAGRWCRSEEGLPAAVGTLFRRADGNGGWVALLGDAGKAVTAVSGTDMAGPQEKTAVVFASAPSFSRAAAFYDAAPSVMTGLAAGLQVLTGRAEPLFEVKIGPKDSASR